MENKIINNKFLYYSLIISFTILYLIIGLVSTVHSISFFQLANPLILAILLGASFEISQGVVLFYILMSHDKKILPWLIMCLLVILQVCGNIYSSFKFIDLSKSGDWAYFQRSILFSVQADSSEMYKVIISIIQGGLLPVCTLAMTSLIAHVIQTRDSMKNLILPNKESETLTSISKEPLDFIKNSSIPKEYVDTPTLLNNHVVSTFDPSISTFDKPNFIKNLSPSVWTPLPNGVHDVNDFYKDDINEDDRIYSKEREKEIQSTYTVPFEDVVAPKLEETPVPKQTKPKKQNIEKILKKKTKSKPITRVEDIVKPSVSEDIFKSVSDTEKSKTVVNTTIEELNKEDTPNEPLSSHNGVDVIDVKTVSKKDKLGIPKLDTRKNFDKP